MPDDLDEILKDIESKKQERLQSELAAGDNSASPETDDADSRIRQDRKNKVSGFKLQLDLDGEMEPAAIPGSSDTATGAEEIPASSEEQPSEEPEGKTSGEPKDETAGAEEEAAGSPEVSGRNTKMKKRGAKTAWGYIRGILYAAIVLCVSGALAYFLIAGGIDLTGLNKSDEVVPVTLSAEQCKSTATVAKVLKEAGVIDQPFIFELYCSVRHVNGTFKPQDQASLSADMGYSAIVGVLRSTKRKTVTVTIPEGTTVDDIAKKLEKSGVCSASDFYMAMENSGSYGYSFISEIPSDAAHKGRHNKLEGYIFPDTYEFYVGSSGETAVRKFLDAFQSRVNASVQAAAKAKGMTLDEAVTLASIIQWESAKTQDMYKISAVLHNRLNNTSAFPHLQCDSTRKFIDSIWPPVNKVKVENDDYDTYKRVGLPVGPINNPGLDAIQAAITPADTMKGYYYFATDTNTGKTYYSKTLAQHEAVCTRYGIGMYGE